jgi:lysophospholipase L1-like esterase
VAQATFSVLAQVGALLALVGPAPAAPAAAPYVALGDSYSSGTGTSAYGLSPRCQRSRFAYPALVAKRRSNLKLVFAACAGATTDDVLLDQVSRLNAATRLVTITIGGNDVGFVEVLATCAQSRSGSGACGSAIERGRTSIRRTLPAKLDAVYSEIRQRAPDARVIVLGYPRLFTRPGCGSVGAAEAPRLNRAATLLRDTVRGRVKAAGAGFSFRDAIPAFEGHGICAGSPWINGIVSPLTDSFHPNRAGHSGGYGPLVLRAIGRSP